MAKLPRTVGFGIPKLLNVLAAREIDDAVGSCPTSLAHDVGRLFDGSSGSIRWCNMVNPNWALRVCGTRLPREEGTGPARERQCSAIILPLRCFPQRSSWAISPGCSATRCDPKARPRSSAHRDGLWGTIWLGVSAFPDPGARKAVLELAESFDRLARAAATPTVLRRGDLAMKDRERNW